jgi:hypothetical protein
MVLESGAANCEAVETRKGNQASSPGRNNSRPPERRNKWPDLLLSQLSAFRDTMRSVDSHWTAPCSRTFPQKTKKLLAYCRLWRFITEKDTSTLNSSREVTHIKKNKKQSPWPVSASELYRPSDRRLSAKWLLTCADRGCHVVSVTDPSGRIIGFLDRSRYFSIK